MAKAKAKKQNFIQAYFADFGLRQICDFLMIAGAIVIIVGLSATAQIVLTVGLGIYIVASAIALFRSAKILLSGINHRAPEYKNAIINVCIMGAIFVLAVFAFVYSLLY